MGENKKQKGFFYITRRGIVVYDGTLSTPLTFPFDKNTVADFEIINKEEFAKQFAAFLQQNKITPGVMTIVLGEDAFFEKEISGLEKAKKDETIKLFIESVPFEHVAINSFPTKTGSKIIGTNKDFFDVINEIVTKLGFTVQYVIPAYYFDRKIDNIDVVTGKYILEKIPSLRQATLSGYIEEKHVEPQPIETTTKKGKGKKLSLLIAVFLILVLILGGLIYFSMKQTP